MPVEGQGEKNLWWYSIKRQSRRILEPKLSVVFGMTHQTTSLSIHRSQPQQPLPHQGFSNALSLMRWQHRNRSKGSASKLVIAAHPGD
jgi:hypothetical protein